MDNLKQKPNKHLRTLSAQVKALTLIVAQAAFLINNSIKYLVQI